jgi:asparagine synthase (glutamine-hydrolysing)
VQRLRRQSSPPAGGELLASQVVAHWQEHPETLAPLAALGVFRQDWLAAVVDGDELPPTSAVAFMVNLVAACGAELGGDRSAG